MFWLESALLITLSVLAVFALTSREASTDPFPSCNASGILFQYPGGTDTQVHLIDMASGNDSQPAGTPIPNRTINAIGYNAQDHFLYGWDNTNNVLLRIHSDWSVEELTIDDGGGGNLTPTNTIIIGDVDENGLYWFIDGNGGSNGQDYYAIDVTVPGTTVTIDDSGTTSGIPASHSAGADWVYVPGGAGLYRVMHDQVNDQGRLLVFDRDTGAFSSVGLIPQSQLPHDDLKEGAFYADVDGNMYVSDNDDGNIYRVDISGPSATLFANGPASGSNDGARCVDAAVHVDYGDAPDDYNTLLASGGPRHSIANFIETTSVGTLMLGKKIDPENDGLPTVAANGDDDNHSGTPFVDDEDSVQHIVITPGSLDPVEVPVQVTNTGSQQATLAGWIDFDGDNAFETGERVTATVPAGFSGHRTLTFTPTGALASNTYARFRLFSGDVADPQPTGPAATAGGEVEDYLAQVGSFSVSKIADPPEGSAVDSGQTVTYTLSIQNTGTTNLTDLTIHDDLTDVLDDATLEGNPVVDPPSAGTTSVTGNTLEFKGDVSTGQTVKVSYKVTVNDAGNLNNALLNNMIIAAHTNCHPEIGPDQTVSVNDPDCQTTHQVTGALAPTGLNPLAIKLLAVGLIISAALTLAWKRYPLLKKLGL